LALQTESRGRATAFEIMNELIRLRFEDIVPYWARTSDGPDTSAPWADDGACYTTRHRIAQAGASLTLREHR
jgi:hypothetical protein